MKWMINEGLCLRELIRFFLLWRGIRDWFPSLLLNTQGEISLNIKESFRNVIDMSTTMQTRNPTNDTQTFPQPHPVTVPIKTLKEILCLWDTSAREPDLQNQWSFNGTAEIPEYSPIHNLFTAILNIELNCIKCNLNICMKCEMCLNIYTHTHTSLPSVLPKASCFIVINLCSAFFSVALDPGNQYLFDFFYKVQQFIWTVRLQRFTETPFLFHRSLTLTRAIRSLKFLCDSVLKQCVVELLLYTLKIVTIKIYCFSSI